MSARRALLPRLARRWPLVLAAAVLLVAALARGEAPFRSRSARILEVEPAPFVRRIEASGELRPVKPLTIGCPSIRYVWEYTITSLVADGTEVTAGTPVVSFDTREQRERLDLRRSQLATARSELEKTRLEEQDKLDKLMMEHAELEARLARIQRKLDVPEQLIERNELVKTRIDERLAERELELNQRQIELQRKNMATKISAAEQHAKYLEQLVEQSRRNIEAMTVRAPRDGFVALAEDWNGNKPKVGETVWQGRPIVEIADLRAMQVEAQVDEPDAAYVAAGQPVEIRLDAAPDRLFHGKVVRLGRLFHTKSPDVPKKVFDAVIAIDDPDPELMRPGMAAQVVILARAPGERILLPEEAVRPTPRGPLVRVRDDRGEHWVEVVLGERWQGRVTVERGLAPGDRVVVPRGTRS